MQRLGQLKFGKQYIMQVGSIDRLRGEFAATGFVQSAVFA
jgi:hypothetical protein